MTQAHVPVGLVDLRPSTAVYQVRRASVLTRWSYSLELPVNIRAETSQVKFTKLLKTHFFNLAFCG